MRPLSEYSIGDYVYVRQEQRHGEPVIWILALVVSRRIWREPISQSRASVLAGGSDGLGPLQEELIAVEADSERLFAHGFRILIRAAEIIRPRKEFGSWDRMIRRWSALP
jgi:hypothetical protein